MSEPDKANGVNLEDNKVNPPCSQRRLKLNRRSFLVSRQPLVDLLSDKSDQEISSVNRGDDDRESKVKKDAPDKRIISFASVKSNTSEKSSSAKGRESFTSINLERPSFSPAIKRNEKCATAEDPSSSGSPLKKKHKPITWP